MAPRIRQYFANNPGDPNQAATGREGLLQPSVDGRAPGRRRPIRQNVLANGLGGSWSALSAIAVIPFEIRILGTESYAVLAFMASIQIVLSVLDLGLSPTIAREVAIDHSIDGADARHLVEAIWLPYSLIGLVIGVALISCSHWLAADWINLTSLPVSVATRTLQLCGLSVALRWPVSFYNGVLAGRHRFDVTNGIRASIATVQMTGIVTCTLATRSLPLVAGWMALTALIEVTCYMIACRNLLPGLRFAVRIQVSALKRIWRFSLEMNVINVLSIALTQSDRLIISRLLPAAVLGYYSLAYNVVLGLSLLQGFITTAMFPVFASDEKSGRQNDLGMHYRKASQALVALYALPVGLLVFFGEDILRVVATNQTAPLAAPILSILAIGFLLNASMSIPYTLATATGHTRIPIAVNAISLCIYLPVLYISIRQGGGTGAALAWLALNTSYLLTLLPIVQRHIARAPVSAWLRQAFLPFAGAALLIFGGVRVLVNALRWQSPFGVAILAALGVAAYSLVAFFMLDGEIRADMLRILGATAKRIGWPRDRRIGGSFV